MKRMAIASALLALAGCGKIIDPGQAADDGHSFIRRQFDRPAVLVRKVEYASYTALQNEARKRKVMLERQSADGFDRRVYAFGFVSTTNAACEIHFVAPEASEQKRWIGHELLHCFYGQWHD